MFNHKNIDEHITAYLLNELDETEEQVFHEHLANCETCMKALQFQQITIEQIEKKGDAFYTPRASGPAGSNIFRMPESLVYHYHNPGTRRAALMLSGVAVLLILVSVLIITPMKKRDLIASMTLPPELLAKVSFQDKVPYEFNPQSILRGGPSETTNKIRDDFQQQFLAAMFSYGDRDYRTCVDQLLPLQQKADQLAKSGDKTDLFLASEYYFYRGVAHLALKSKELQNTVADSSARNWKPVLQALLQSQKLAGPHRMTEAKYYYFLGLANGLSGDCKAAIEMFEKIPDDNSEFGASKQKMAAYWESQLNQRGQ